MPAEHPMLLLPNPLDLALVHVVVDSVPNIPHDQAQGNALLRPLLAVGRPLAFRLSGKVDIQAMFRNPTTPLALTTAALVILINAPVGWPVVGCFSDELNGSNPRSTLLS